MGTRETHPDRVSDGPLWGRRADEFEAFVDAGEFQTDPCGVEAGPKNEPGVSYAKCFRWPLLLQ
ncbi:hypothetical protein NJ7G_3321 [Natrinema sp. J7-2]|nr:hypothetical protein NJ7G_3321 [Natrinema sp. J7-2]